MGRTEDASLLSGAARFIADLAPVGGLCHAAILRSPHAHAEIRAIDATKAQVAPGVIGVLTPSDVTAMSEPIANLFRLPAHYYPCAVGVTRYVGEPVAVVVAKDRYLAEDALDLIEVDYRPLAAVVDAQTALHENAPVLHSALGTNRVHHRTFRYGDPERAFANAARVISAKWRYPRVSSTPVEGVWRMLFDPRVLARAIPGCCDIAVAAPNQWRAIIGIKIAGIGGRYEADIAFDDLAPPHAFRARGGARGKLGEGRGEARVTLCPEGDGTRLSYVYSASLAGPLASFGHRFLEGVVAILIAEFFERLATDGAGAAHVAAPLVRLLRRARIMWRNRRGA